MWVQGGRRWWCGGEEEAIYKGSKKSGASSECPKICMHPPDFLNSFVVLWNSLHVVLLNMLLVQQCGWEVMLCYATLCYDIY